MKKLKNKGFVLAETLVVTVFLMVIFGMLYSNFYPLIGEYEKRETYDDVDGKYSVYWLKKIIEDSDYHPSEDKKKNLNTYHFMRFECDDITDSDQKRDTCKTLVQELEVEGCNKSGNDCNIFIVPYNISNFKNTVDSGFKRFNEDCIASVANEDSCKTRYINKCVAKDLSGLSPSVKSEKCTSRSTKSVFDSGMVDYIATLPDYIVPSLNNASYRVIASFYHKKDNNNYYSYATIEVSR